MRFLTVLLSAMMLTLGTTTAFAQPNFEGHWVQEVVAGPPTDGGGRGGGGGGPGGRGRGNPQGAGSFGNDFVATQDAKTLTIRRVDTQTEDTLFAVFNLDGSDSPSKALFGGGYQPAQQVSTAKWEKDKLTITSYGVDASGARIGGATARPIVTIVWMNGKQLRIETNRPGNNNGNDTSILAIFNKAKK